MWQDDDTRLVFDDENEEKMRIQDDTHEAFGVPDDTLQAFRDMPNGGDRSSSSKKPEGLPRIPSGKDPPVGQDITDENAVWKFLHQSAKFDEAIVDLIITEGGYEACYLQMPHRRGPALVENPHRHGQALIDEGVPMMLK